MPIKAPPEIRPRLAVVAGCVLIPLLAVIDYATGYQLGFFVFYFVPVGLLAWYRSRASGLVAALACAMAWYLVDSLGDHPYPDLSLGIWNALVRLAAFAVVAVTLAKMRAEQERRIELNLRLAATIAELERSVARISALQNDVQIICAWTKRIKSEGRWMQFEEFMERHFQMRFSHGISEEGARELKAEMSHEPPDSPDRPKPAGNGGA